MVNGIPIKSWKSRVFVRHAFGQSNRSCALGHRAREKMETVEFNPSLSRNVSIVETSGSIYCGIQGVPTNQIAEGRQKQRQEVSILEAR